MSTLNVSLIFIPWRLISDTDVAFITAVNPYSDYVDGKKVEGIAGYKYTATLKSNIINKYKDIDVKVAGVSPVITPKMLEENGGEIEAVFTNFAGRIYINNGGRPDMSGTASAITIATKKV